MALLGRLGEIAPSHSVSMKCVLCTSTRQEPRTAMPLPKLCVSHLQHSMIFLAKKKKKKVISFLSSWRNWACLCLLELLPFLVC